MFWCSEHDWSPSGEIRLGRRSLRLTKQAKFYENTFHSKPAPASAKLKITFFSRYTDQVYEIEKVLARKPEKFQIDLVGSGEIPPDAALLIRSVLLKRSPTTHLITNARSGLQGGAVLVWLLGDTRLIRDDAKLYFRKPTDQNKDEDNEAWKQDPPETPEVDLEELDYAEVLQHIDEFLPVGELAAGIDSAALKEFGLVDSKALDDFLETAFAIAAGNPDAGKRKLRTRSRRRAKIPRSDGTNQAQQ
jgi:hypothetical protein